MKAIQSITLSSIFALTMLVSGCGGAGKTTASLEIVNGFLVSANGYDGGLIIHGKKDSGEVFSVSLTNSVTTSLELPNGSWTFSAIGWNGDDADITKKFSGTPYCGSATANLNGTTVNVSLGLDPSKCDSDVFAGSAHRLSGLLDFGDIITLKSLVYPVSPTNAGSVASHEIQAADSKTSIFGSMPEDLYSSVGSIRVYALNKGIRSADYQKGFASLCLSASGLPEPGVANKSSSAYSALSFKLPSRTIPMGIEFYKKYDCTSPAGMFVFPNGFENSSNGDHLFQVVGSQNRLILSATDSLKGYSPFQALMPYIKCSGAKCSTPSLVPDYLVPVNSSATLSIPVNACLSPYWTAGPMSVVSCAGSNPINLVLDTTSGSATTGYVLVVNGGASYDIGLVDDSIPGFEDRQKREFFRDLYDGFGPSSITSFKPTFINANHDQKDDEGYRYAYGRLGRVRQHLSSAGAAGLLPVNKSLSFEANCMAASGSIDKSFTNDDGTVDSYRISVSNFTSHVSANAYPWTCDTTDENASSCSTIYDKTVRVYRTNGPTPSVPEMTMVLDCQNLIGKFEHGETSYDNGIVDKNISQSIVSWNTDPAGGNAKQRFEYLSREQRFVHNGTTYIQKDENRIMGRVFKTDPNRIQMVSYSFNSHENSGPYQQVIEARHAHIVPGSSIACIDNRSAATNDVDPTYILTNIAFSTARTSVQIPRTTPALELPYLAYWPSATLATATSTCTTTNQFLANPANNPNFNGSLTPMTESLNSLPAQFGAFLGH